MSTTLVNINTAKEQAETYQPLLLAQIQWADGTTLFLSTHNISYGGHTYLPRVLSHQLGPTSTLDAQGITLASTAAIKCADGDSWIYTNFESPRGFKGATLTLLFVYYDVISGNFSPDSIVRFIGRCGSPTSINDQTITIPALNKYNLAPYNTPSLQIQALCPWVFPTTPALQEAAANGSNQQSKECPYNPNGTTMPRGNLDSSTGLPFTYCGKSKNDCIARGMYISDSLGRLTGTFGGIQFNPPTSSISRSYETTKFGQVLNNGPEAKYGDVVPLMYGEGWTQCKVLNSWSDANYWRGEVLICYGKIGVVFKVLVNNIEIPHIFGDPYGITPPGVTTTQQALKIGWWQFVNDGSVYSAPGSAYAGKGDPYGSMAVLYIQVVVDIAASSSVPNVQVLLQGQLVRVYSTPTVYAEQFSSNPWWHILDLLTWANLEYSDVDLATLITVASFADTLIGYISQYGSSGFHPRFSFTLSLTTANTADQTLRSCLNAVRGAFMPNSASGLLSPRTWMTLGDQQPAPMDGSNYNTPVASFDSLGAAKTGYWSYYFTEGTMIEDGNNYSVELTQVPLQQAPNKLGYVFQDSENTYVQDSINLVADDDVALTGQVVSGNVQIAGPNTYDHGQRILATKLAEMLRGNHRLAADGSTTGDTGGTINIKFPSTHRAVKVQAGDIIGVDSVKRGWVGQSFRVRSIEAADNYERVTISASFHNDGWYIDTYGQTGAKPWTSGWRSPTLNGARPLQQFGVPAVTYGSNNGIVQATVTLQVAPGVNIPNGTIQPPYVPIQSVSANTGGTLPGGHSFYFCLVAINSSGPSAPSNITSVYVAPGTNTNTVTVPNLYWDASTTSFQVFAGNDPNSLTKQVGNYTTTGGTSAQPGSITITSALTSAGELPDNKLAKIRFKQERVAFPGVWTGSLFSATFAFGVWTLQLNVGAGTPFTTNALVGRQIALLGRAAPTEGAIFPLVVPSGYPSALTITANTATTLTVSGDSAGLVAFVAGDQITIRMAPTFGSDSTGNYIQDAWFVNPNSAGLSQSFFAPPLYFFFPNLRIVGGTGQGYTMMCQFATMTATKLYIVGAWPITPDATSIFVIDEGSWDQTIDTGTIYNDGSLTSLSYTMDASAWAGTTILLQAVSLDANGNESSSILAPMREVYLLNTVETDTDVPPTPSFSLTTDSRGQLVLSGVGFASSASNISTVTSGTLQVFLRDLTNSTGETTLAAAVTLSASTIALATAQTYGFGQALVIDDEVVLNLTVGPATTLSVVRASLGSSAAAHALGANVYPLSSVIYTPDFPPLFFSAANSAAQSIYQYPIAIPRRIVYAAEMTVTNSVGASPATSQSYATAGGISTGAAGNSMLTITAYGTLGIAANIAPIAQSSIPIKPTAVLAVLSLGPVGSSFTLNINVGGSLWLSLTIPAVTSGTASSVTATPAQLASLTTLPAFTAITVDVTAVGSVFPGSSLALQVFA